MGKFKVKYASKLNIPKNWVYAPGHWFRFDWDKLQSEFPEPACFLVALDEQQLNLLHHMLSVFPKYKRNWAAEGQLIQDGEWDEIQSWVSELEGCLMAGCNVEDLVQVQGLMAEHLERIAVATEGLDAKMPQLVPLDGILTALDEHDTFQELAALLEIFDLIPGIDISLPVHELLKFGTDAYFKAKLLTAQAQQATAQTAIMKAMIVDELKPELNAWINALMSALELVDVVGDGWNSFFANLLYLYEVFGTDEEIQPEVEPRISVEVLNDVFVEGDALTINNFVDACCNGGTQAPPADYEDDGETPPSGFDDYETYDQHKCNASQMYINSLKQDLAYLYALDVATVLTLTSGGLVTVLFVPGINVAVLIGVLITFVGGAIYAETVADAIDWVDEHEQEILCAIYQAADAATAKSAVSDLITSSGLGSSEKLLLSFFVTQDAFNVAFFNSNVPDLGANCSLCDGCVDVNVILGSWDTNIRFQSELHPTISTHMIQIFFEDDELSPGTACASVTINSITLISGSPSEGLGAKGYRIADSSGNNLYNDNTPPGSPITGANRVYIRDNTAPLNQITVDIDWTVE